MARFSPELTEVLLKATTYRGFLQGYLKTGGSGGTSISYSQLALRAGFSSRAYVREVAVGQRRLTVQSLPAFVRAMKLNADWAEYFRLLLSMEENDANTSRLNKDELKRQLQNLRARICRKDNKNLPPVGQDTLFSIPHVFQIYAGLGEPSSKGVSLEKLSQRTRLDLLSLKKSLSKLEELNIVEQCEEGFRVKDLHLIQGEIRKSESFQFAVLKSLERTAKSAKNSIDSSEELFFISSLLVRRADLPRMKEELRDLLIKFVDKHLDESGDSVVNMTVSLNL